MEKINVKIDPSICPKCLGTGKVDGQICDICWGKDASPGSRNNGRRKKIYELSNRRKSK